VARLAAVVLAAGAGTRLGGVAKALLGEPTFLARVVATAREVGVTDVVVAVAEPFGARVEAAARLLGARVVWNPAPERGMGGSIALGFGALTDASDAAWLWPVDHPHVRASTLRTLAGALAGHDVARPLLGGRRGHPPLVARRAWPRLVACADIGARAALAACDAIDIPVDDVGVVRDVDVPADLESAS
jgi:molybdenum cofactor cytidylyltransferase